jgi:hypothetical protein
MKVRVRYAACGGSLGKYRRGEGSFSIDARWEQDDELLNAECRRRAIKNTGCHNAVVEWIEVEWIPE